ncbi:MAG: hypothetical protein ACHP9Y_01765 [Gammaproteobacteria bacterium]
MKANTDSIHEPLLPTSHDNSGPVPKMLADLPENLQDEYLQGNQDYKSLIVALEKGDLLSKTILITLIKQKQKLLLVEQLPHQNSSLFTRVWYHEPYSLDEHLKELCRWAILSPEIADCIATFITQHSKKAQLQELIITLFKILKVIYSQLGWQPSTTNIEHLLDPNLTLSNLHEFIFLLRGLSEAIKKVAAAERAQLTFQLQKLPISICYAHQENMQWAWDFLKSKNFFCQKTIVAIIAYAPTLGVFKELISGYFSINHPLNLAKIISLLDDPIVLQAYRLITEQMPNSSVKRKVAKILINFPELAIDYLKLLDNEITYEKVMCPESTIALPVTGEFLGLVERIINYVAVGKINAKSLKTIFDESGHNIKKVAESIYKIDMPTPTKACSLGFA